MNTSLQIGKIVGYFEQGRFVFGQVLETSQTHCLLYTFDNPKAHIPLNRLILQSHEQYHVSDNGLALQNFSSMVMQKLAETDFDRLLKGIKANQTDYTLEELSDLLLNMVSDVAIFTVYLALREHPEYFATDGQRYILRPETKRADYLHRAVEKQLQQRYQTAVSVWLKSLFECGITDSATADYPVFPMEFRDRFEDDLYQHLTGKSLSWLKKVLSSHCDKPDSDKHVYQIRLALGQIHPDTDPKVALSGLPVRFGRDIIALAEAVNEYKPNSGYWDLTSLACLTIDDDSTADADDAISIIRTASGWQIGVHIVLAAAFFTADSPLEAEARHRTSSIYTDSESVYMLPERICCDVACLKAGTIRPALSMLFELSEDCHVLSHSYCVSNIRIEKHLSYADLDEMLFCAAPKPEHNALLRFAANHLEMRLQRGAVVPDDFGICSARRLVAECMVAYNHLMAIAAMNAGLPFIYRCLEDAILYDEEGEIRFIPNSVYNTAITQHQAMGLSIYAHLTSPLRRYADLVNQRQLLALLSNTESQYEVNYLEELIPHLNRIRSIIRSIS